MITLADTNLLKTHFKTFHIELNLLIILESEEDTFLLSELIQENYPDPISIYHKSTIKDGREALLNSNIDAVLIDLTLPDSYGLFSYTKLFEDFPEIPFIVLTGIEDELIGINAVKNGAQDFLVKGNFDGLLLNRSIQYSIERKKTEDTLRRSENRYKALFHNSIDAIYMTNQAGDFIDINPSGLELFEIDKNRLKSYSANDLYIVESERQVLLEYIEKNNGVKDFEIKLKKQQSGTEIDCLLSTIRIFDETNNQTLYQGIIRDITAKKKAERALNQSLKALDKANESLMGLNNHLEELVDERTFELNREKEIVEVQNLEIKKSIQYAKRIQTSILPSLSYIRETLPDSFVYYQPKDIVSGDFYWFTKIGAKVIIAAVDCTGHGVPGAFMSIIGYTALNYIVNDKRILEPSVILKELDKQVKISINQQGADIENSYDGMELGVCVIDVQQGILEFSGANRPMYFINKDGLQKITTSKSSIGGDNKFTGMKEFSTFRTKYHKGDSFYLLSDGYVDQFGGPKGKKFMSKNINRLIEEISHLPMRDQGKLFEKNINDWKGLEDQVDDILVIGIRL
jgi:PAS domain S-box-containing protein